ncbi:hypothetical protein [Agaribacterium sp. ZY112]|uniref:hypothetical protein n=1 Tax=Agaribacterium sp. ZY112 TaxID=3233574 RepID=UPI00352447A7
MKLKAKLKVQLDECVGGDKSLVACALESRGLDEVEPKERSIKSQTEYYVLVQVIQATNKCFYSQA